MVLLTGWLLALAAAGAAAPDPGPRPPLVVLIVVDQMRADYLDRFAPVFHSGLARMRKESVRFTRCRQQHAVTSTGPGHATLGTGRHPAKNGVIANTVPGPNGKFHAVSVDAGEQMLSRKASGVSSRDLLTDGLGDWIQAADPASQVVSLALKSRSAAMLGGLHPDVCVFADEGTGSYDSSTFYCDALPAFVRAFNAEHPVEGEVGRRWEPKLDDATFERLGCTADDMPWEGRYGFARRDDAAFPHVLESAKQIEFFPFGDERTLALALAAVDALGLGEDASPDLLCVGLSASDYVGHAWGPESRELADYYARLDPMLGDFLAAVESRVPDVLFALAADHGVSPILEQQIARGMRAGRIFPRDVAASIDRALDHAFGDDDWVVTVQPDVYLSAAAVARHGRAAAEVEDAAAAAAKQIDGIEEAYPRHLLLDAKSDVPDAWRFAFNPVRSGDVMLRLERWFQLDYLDIAPYVRAQHASDQEYDQRIPLVFLHRGWTPEIRTEPVGAVDLAPTIAACLRVPAPGDVDGRDLRLPRP